MQPLTQEKAIELLAKISAFLHAREPLLGFIYGETDFQGVEQVVQHIQCAGDGPMFGIRVLLWSNRRVQVHQPRDPG